MAKPDEMFFVLDSTSVDEVQSSLYGYVLDEHGVHTDYLAGELGGNGCYVRITADERKINIEQDANGSFGLYLYRSGKYFAISNSFFRLQDFLKARVPLSVNYDYCVAFFALGLASLAYGETAVNEIQCLDRNSEVVIDKSSGSLEIICRNEEANVIPIESREGCEILDKWFSRWSSIVRHLAGKTNRLAVDLSGGFDSRLTFMLALASGCDLSAIQVFTMVSENEVHQQDYAIGQKIAGQFGFDLKKRTYQDCMATDFTLDEIVDLAYDAKMTFHQDVLLWVERMEGVSFRMSGAAGELIRSFWPMDAEEALCWCQRHSNAFGKRHSKWVSQSIGNVIRPAIENVCRKYSLPATSRMVGRCLYRETRCRNHFGRLMLGGMAAGIYWLAPLLDRELHRLKTRFADGVDDNALIALMYERYSPRMLDFPVEGGRTIAPETIEKARVVNDGFARYTSSDTVATFDIPECKSQGNAKHSASIDDVDDYFKRLILSDSAKELILQNFPKGVYEWSIAGIDRKGFVPRKPWQAMAGILKVLDNVECGRTAQAKNKMALDRYIAADMELVTLPSAVPVVRRLDVTFRHKVVVSGEMWCGGENEHQKGVALLQVDFADRNNNRILSKDLNYSEAYGQYVFINVDSVRRKFMHEFHAPEGAASVTVGISDIDDGKNILVEGYSVEKKFWQDISDSDIRLFAGQDKYNWDRVPVKLLPGMEYVLTADGVIVEAGETDFVETKLYESRTKKTCSTAKFAVEGAQAGKIAWHFAVPSVDGEYWLLVYAGVAGGCEGVGVLWKNVVVSMSSMPWSLPIF